jgi:hypothetical protein
MAIINRQNGKPQMLLVSAKKAAATGTPPAENLAGRSEIWMGVTSWLLYLGDT